MFAVIYLEADEAKTKRNLSEQDANALAGSKGPGSYPIIYDMVKFAKLKKELENGLVLRR